MVLPSTVSRRVNGEVVVLLGWGRTILLQLAHPLVAAGVAQHSGFGGGPLNYFRRTHRTVGAMLALTFGSTEEVRERADRINAIHKRVHGVLREPTRHFPADTPYSATDPELLQWVHATLVDSQLRAYELFVETLAAAERDRYCAEAAAVAPLLHIPDHVLPTDAAALDRYLHRMYASPVIEVTESARDLAQALLFPPGGSLTGPAMALGRLATVGLLPQDIRVAYGLPWGSGRQRRLLRAAAAVRGVRRMLPPMLREWPAARRRPGKRTQKIAYMA